MDILESPYFRINKLLLTCLGQWPYQKSLHKCLIRALYFCVIGSMAIPEALRMIDVWGELDYVIDCVSIFGVQFSNCIKISNYIFNADQMKKLMTRMQNDWKSDIFRPHLKIFEKYATEGMKLTKVYSVYMYSTLGSYIIMPAIPVVLDIMMPLNESRPAVYLIPVKYGNVDLDKYYLLVLLHAETSAAFVITAIVATDTTYTLYVQHACGIFTALGEQLRSLMELNDREILDEVSEREHEERTFRSIVQCVKMHTEAIEFANAIESGHVIVFFFVIGMSVFCMSVAGYQTVMNFDRPNEAIRYGLFAIAQVVHIFFVSWPGQKLIDHSQRIFTCIYEAQWFQASSRSKKLLMFMMMRSIEPCKLTAGKFYVMSLASFSMVMRTSMSYFTMLTSFR